MRFLLDESTELRLADYLRAHGHDVKTVASDYQASIADEEVLSLALSERRILITNVQDFGELVFRSRRPHSGVILLRYLDLLLSAKIAGSRKSSPATPAS